MRRLGILVCLLLGGCGFVPTESKLFGAWQVDLLARQKIIYTFKKNHTYTMTISSQAGTLQGTWKLDGNILTTSMGSFAAYGMTNTLPAVKGLGSQKYVIVKLTASSMVWRDASLRGGLELKRVASRSRTVRPPQ